MFAIRLSVSIVDAQKHSRTQTLSDFFLLRQFRCIWFFCSLVALHSTIKCLCYAAARCEWGRQTTNKQTSPKWEFMRFMLMSQSKYPLNLFVWAYVDQPQSLVFFKFGYSVRLKIKVAHKFIHYLLLFELFFPRQEQMGWIFEQQAPISANNQVHIFIHAHAKHCKQ